MIARLRGTMVHREPQRMVLDVQDVGYEVFAPQRDLDAWATEDGPITVTICTQVREDAITLYGFARPEDRLAFQRLLAVSGVGPKVALASLDALGLPALTAAVAQDDVRTLTKIAGVGKKLAQRMALELKGKLPLVVGAEPAPAAAPAPPEAAPDALHLALAKLGYTRTEVNSALRGLKAEGLGPEAPIADRLRRALRLLAKG